MTHIRPLTIEEYKQLGELLEAVRLYCMDEYIMKGHKTKKAMRHSVEYKLYHEMYKIKDLLDELLYKQYYDVVTKSHLEHMFGDGKEDLSRVFYGIGDKVAEKYKMPDSDAKMR
jgi:hypothetical protein